MQTVAQVAHRARDSVNTKFLATLSDTGNMTAACMVAGISRTEMYRRRDADPALRAAWEAAIEVSVDKLELVARDRALQGVKEPVYYKGDVVGHVHKPSDRLMELLLKAHRPDKFNPVQKLEHSGGVSIAVMQFDGTHTAPGAASRTIEHSPLPGAESESASLLSAELPSSEVPSASLPDNERGGVSEGPTPKRAASQNDEPCRVADFSDLKPE